MLSIVLASAVLLAADSGDHRHDAHRPLGATSEARRLEVSGAGGGVSGGEGAGAEALAPMIRVMSFNIRTSAALDLFNRWPSRRAGVATILEGEPAEDEAVGWDVVGLQEATRRQLDDLHRLVPGYAEVAYGRDDGRSRGEHAAIFYNSRRFSLADSGVFWFSRTPEVAGSRSWGASFTRQCCWARLIDRRSGQGVYVFNVHLDHRSAESRRESARLLAERIAEREFAEPVLVLGDFNAGAQSEPVRWLLEAPIGGGLVDAYAAGAGEGPQGTFNGFSGEREGERIDHILLPASGRVLGASIDRRRFEGRWASDHFPVTASVQLPLSQDFAVAGQ